MSEEVQHQSNINEIQDEVIEEFSLFDDWTEKYKYIIEQGRELEPLDDQYKQDDLKVSGCQSTVYLTAFLDENNKLIYKAESDAMIVNGLIALLIRVLSGQKPEDVSNSDLYFIDQIGMKEHLSPTRSNGLAAMVKQMKLYGIAFQQKLQKQA
ncbi:MAG: Fe-S metabolism protein SufE [Bacteroidetes bacterium SW_10_40_5]|nr:MAG: Fe-S metabolism protein SufE [Bacteroidetes bacterium SW_10_40_5]